MSSVNSVSGNNGFTKVDNTLVNVNDVSAALGAASLAPLKSVSGVVTPTAAGNYALVSAGADVTLPLGALVSHVFLHGSSTLAGGTDATVVLAPTSGAGAGVALTAAVPLADLLLGSVPAVVPTVGDAVNQFVSVTTTGTFTAGSVEVTILFM